MTDAALRPRDLVDALVAESRQEAWKIDELHRRPVEERVEELRCIADAVVEEVLADGLRLSCAVNHARFRHGDKVLLTEGATPDPVRALEMEWVEDDGTGTRILLEKSFRSRRMEIPFRPGDRLHLDAAPEDGAGGLVRHLEGLLRSPAREAKVAAFLGGTLADREAPWDPALAAAIAAALELNEGQRAGLKNAVTRFPLSGVQGPAGTGKTTVLAAVALYYLKQGRRVALTAVSHFAINHALNRVRAALPHLGASDPPPEILKVSRNKNHGLIRGVLQVSRLQQAPPSAAPRLAGMTVHKLPLECAPEFFDVLLFDEASQAPLPLAVLAMSHARKTVFFGDHRQLGPVGFEENGRPTAGDSVFAHLARRYPERVAFLHQTYRMSAALCAWPSSSFYEHRLVSMKPAPVADSEDPFGGHPVLRREAEAVLVTMNHREAGKFSAEEAATAAVLTARWIRGGGGAADQAAVVVPFRSQANLIRRALRLLGADAGRDREFDPVLVDTVERMQGQERDYVLLSLTASDPAFLGAAGSHFFQPGRLNVALTRAARKRVTLASPHLVLARFQDLRLLEDVARFARFFDEEPRAALPPDDADAVRALAPRLAWT